MRIVTKLVGGFVAIAILTAVTAYVSVSLSDHVWNLRNVELPMEQHLGQLEESGWEALHAVDSYTTSPDPRFVEEYEEEAADVENYFAAYLALTDTKKEKDAATEFYRVWSAAKVGAETVMTLVRKCKQAEDDLFVHVEHADDVIDSRLQARLSPSDPDVLAKEQALREVEVSIWEAIHAAQQYASLTPTMTRADRAQGAFAELLEKQIGEVAEFWAQYKALAHSEEERKAAADFEAAWAKAVAAGRDVVKLHTEARRQFDRLIEQAEQLDEIVDDGMRACVQERILARDRAAQRAKVIAIVVGMVAILGAVAIGLVLTRSISVPVRRLSDATSELAKGNYAHRIAIARKDEFGLVSEAFNHMAGEMHVSTAKLEAQIVQRTEAEKSLQKANDELTTVLARLSQANDELREFVYIASHDLREPLRKISSFGSMLKDSLEEKLDADDRENLMFMIDGANRMTQMIEGLLTYSRVNTSEKARDVIDLNETVRDLLHLELGALIEETGALVEVPQALPKVLGNPAQIGQLLQNLIGNGIKYSRDDVAPRIVLTAEDAGDGDVRISVRDNGIGIPAEHYENIFKMFRRLHSRRKYSGTGIGLAVCKRIVDKHGGRIGVESREGEGTTFWFTLVRAGAAETEASPAVAVASV
ncbi:MAG TPA: ATP-binding protein [Phycisphaerae bacterium]|nr:ATP-binding protein [Phycisphaerae bacterium]